jgi:hypothetical protein
VQISQYDGSRLRLILIGMITDQKVCSRISSFMDKSKGPHFKSKWASIIAKWCKDYFQKYGSPPGENIEAIFRRWSQVGKTDPESVKYITRVLEYLSSEYAQRTIAKDNADFILDLASDYFSTESLRSVVDKVEDDITVGEVNKAYDRLESVSRVRLGYSSVLKPLVDNDVWLESIKEDEERSLFEYPGVLGELTKHSFTRGSLFAFMGVEKSGKSFYLIDAAFRAMKKRYNVAYFEVGDLGRDEVFQRLGQRILHETSRRESVKWPVDWDTEHDSRPVFSKRLCSGISIGHALKKVRKYSRGRDLLRLSCHPNSTINVAQIDDLIQEWAKDECWIPAVVVIDYADILAPPHGFLDVKDQIDETWKQLRRLSQKYNCLVLTATQTSAQTYRRRGVVLTRLDFSGRKTKLAHVNGMLGINSTPEDIKYGVTRINWVVRRKGESWETRQVLVAGCFAAGMPIILSKFASRRPYTSNGSEDRGTGNSPVSDSKGKSRDRNR